MLIIGEGKEDDNNNDGGGSGGGGAAADDFDILLNLKCNKHSTMMNILK
jgi:hypothetical protein